MLGGWLGLLGQFLGWNLLQIFHASSHLNEISSQIKKKPSLKKVLKQCCKVSVITIKSFMTEVPMQINGLVSI